MDTTDRMSIIELDSLDTAFAVEPGREEETKRRFMTLLVDGGKVPQGATSSLSHAYNTAGEQFALKSLCPLPQKWTRSKFEGEGQAPTPGQSSAFFEGYRNQLTVSHLRGFPKVYGYGTTGDVPVILMEWVEGVTLTEVRPELPKAGDGTGVDPKTVARLGIALFDVLSSATRLDGVFAHRDLSPRNVMLRTDSSSVEGQVTSGRFDLCLVDLGSSSVIREDASYTMRTDIWRNATPEYAPPEMLTRDVKGIDELRHSPAIDVYAACGMLYDLYAGRTPYQVGLRDCVSYYRLKMDEDPTPLEARVPEDQPLVDAIMAGLAREQDERPSVIEMARRLRAFVGDGDEGGQLAEASVGVTSEHGVHLTMRHQSGDPKRLDDGGSARTRGGKRTSERETRGGGRGVSRRAAIALGGAAALGLVAGGLATGWYGISARLTGVRGNLGEYSWDELSDISSRIAGASSDDEALDIARRHHLVGDDGKLTDATKAFEMLDGTKLEAEVIGMRHDTLTGDGSRKAGLTLLVTTPAYPRAMNEGEATGGWESCAMRSWMGDDLLGLLPSDLARRVRMVEKLTNNTGGTKDPACVTATHETLWLPSYCELMGEREDSSFTEDYRWLKPIMNSEGGQYKRFSDLGLRSKMDSQELVREYEGKPCLWWLRTPSPDCSLENEGGTWFNRVGPDGNAFFWACVGSASTDTDGISPNCLAFGFCI